MNVGECSIAVSQHRTSKESANSAISKAPHIMLYRQVSTELNYRRFHSPRLLYCYYDDDDYYYYYYYYTINYMPHGTSIIHSSEGTSAALQLKKKSAVTALTMVIDFAPIPIIWL
jgi:hypothetical protein